MILIVEDDSIIAEGLELSLKGEGEETKVAGTVKEALDIINNEAGRSIDFCLLDVNLPDGNGMDICIEIRKRSDIPIIFLTACDDEIHTVLALEKGADDYIAKLFHIRELLARMKVAKRKYDTINALKSQNATETVYKIGMNEVDINSAVVTRNNEEVILTAMEYKLLLVMINNAGNILSRQQILNILWDDLGNYVNDNTLTVYIKRLRKKLDDEEGRYIETVRGIGYRLKI